MRYFKHLFIVGLVGLTAACGNNNKDNNSNNGCPAGYTYVANGTNNPYNAGSPYPYGGSPYGYGYGTQGNSATIASTTGTGICVTNPTNANAQACVSGQIYTQMGCLTQCTLQNGSPTGVQMNGQCIDSAQINPNGGNYPNTGYPNGGYPIGGTYPYGGYTSGLPYYGFGVNLGPSGYNYGATNFGPIQLQYGYPRFW